MEAMLQVHGPRSVRPISAQFSPRERLGLHVASCSLVLRTRTDVGQDACTVYLGTCTQTRGPQTAHRQCDVRRTARCGETPVVVLPGLFHLFTQTPAKEVVGVVSLFVASPVIEAVARTCALRSHHRFPVGGAVREGRPKGELILD